MNNIPLRCSKCNAEKTFTLESARKFNKDNRYVCQSCSTNKVSNNISYGGLTGYCYCGVDLGKLSRLEIETHFQRHLKYNPPKPDLITGRVSTTPLDDKATIIREQIRRNIESDITQFPCTHGHKIRSNCPLCGYQQPRQQSTASAFEISILAIIAMVFIVIVVGIIMWNPFGPQPFDQDIKTPNAIQVPIDKKCPTGYHRAYPAILCRIN